MGRFTIIFATSIVGLTAACHDNQQQAQDPSSMAMTTAAPVATVAPTPTSDGTSVPQVTNATSGDSATTGNTANGGASTTAATKGATGTNGATATNTPPAPPPAPTTTAPTNPNADNSRMNATASGSAGLTAADQGGSEGDRKITQQIRKAVMGDGSLSFMAKNVKIITINGKVTLKGPVKSDQERAAIEAAAKRVAGDSQVDNQIEIKK